MILDLRIYTVKPGRVPEFLALYKEKAWPTQQKYLGQCVFWSSTAEGPLNQVVHCWAYQSQADREARRGAMAKDPAWAEYQAASKAADLLVSMENRFLSPTEFSPLK